MKITKPNMNPLYGANYGNSHVILRLFRLWNI